MQAAICKRELNTLAKSKSNLAKKPVSQEEYTTNKVLTVFSVCLLGVLLLMVVQRLLDYGTTVATGFLVLKVLIGVGVLGVLWALYLFARERAGKRSASRRIICSRSVLIASIVLIAAMTVVNLYGVGPIKGLYVILPALAVYYLVFHSYSPEFFLIAADCGIAAGLIWAVRRAQISTNYTYMVWVIVAAMAVLALAQIALTAKLQKNKGQLSLLGRKLHTQLSRNAFGMLLLTPIVMTVLVAAVAAIPTAGMICLGIAVAYLFVTAVYYTVKLM